MLRPQVRTKAQIWRKSDARTCFTRWQQQDFRANVKRNDVMFIIENAIDPTEADDTDDSSGGEDDSSTEKNGDDSHLHEDQKSRTLDV